MWSIAGMILGLLMGRREAWKLHGRNRLLLNNMLGVLDLCLLRCRLKATWRSL